MRHRPRNPVGSQYRWRDGHAKRPDLGQLAALERLLRVEIGLRLTQVLRDHDIAASELAAALRVHRTAVQHWTSGRELPSLRRLVAIAAAIGCPLGDLLPEEVLTWPPLELERAA